MPIARPEWPGSARPMRWLITVKAAQHSPAAAASATPSGSSASPISGVSSTMPRAASPIHAKSRPRREVTTASPSGPTNSMATAMPSGMRAMAP